MSKEPMSQHDYLANPNHCHVCRSDNIEGCGIEVNSNIAWQPIRCVVCDASWSDQYILHSYEMTETP